LGGAYDAAARTSIGRYLDFHSEKAAAFEA
jgi:hypothetical protein